MIAKKRAALLSAAALLGLFLVPLTVEAEDDARTKQLRLLCAQLSGDLTEPGGIAAFRRCLNEDPLSAMRKNVFGVPETGPPPEPPKGFGRNSRTNVANAVAAFEAVGDKILYVLAIDGKLWRATVGTQDGKVVDPAVAAFHALDVNVFYALGSDGKLWRDAGDGAARRFVDAEVVAFQPIDGTIVYVLGRNGRLWRETGDMHDRSLVDDEVASFQVVDAATIYVKGKDGKLWRERSSKSDRALVGSDVVDFRIAGETVYILTRMGNTLWRKTGAGAPEQVGAGISHFQPIDARRVYALANDGLLWIGEGPNAAYDLVDTDLLLETGTRSFQAVDAEHLYVLSADHKLWAEKMPSRR